MNIATLFLFTYLKMASFGFSFIFFISFLQDCCFAILSFNSNNFLLWCVHGYVDSSVVYKQEMGIETNLHLKITDGSMVFSGNQKAVCALQAGDGLKEQSTMEMFWSFALFAVFFNLKTLHMVEVYSELEWFFILYFCLQFFVYFQIRNKKEPSSYCRFLHGNLRENSK